MNFYRDTQDTYVLSFSDRGLEIAATVTSLAAAAAVERLDRRIESGQPVRAKDVVRLAEVFVRHVEQWNLRTYAGAPIPVTIDAFLMQHRDQVVLPALGQWSALVRNPSPAPAVEPDELARDEPTMAGIAVSEIEDMLGAQALSDPADGEQPVQEPGSSDAEPVLAGVPAD